MKIDLSSLLHLLGYSASFHAFFILFFIFKHIEKPIRNDEVAQRTFRK